MIELKMGNVSTETSAFPTNYLDVSILVILRNTDPKGKIFPEYVCQKKEKYAVSKGESYPKRF